MPRTLPLRMPAPQPSVARRSGKVTYSLTAQPRHPRTQQLSRGAVPSVQPRNPSPQGELRDKRTKNTSALATSLENTLKPAPRGAVSGPRVQNQTQAPASSQPRGSHPSDTHRVPPPRHSAAGSRCLGEAQTSRSYPGPGPAPNTTQPGPSTPRDAAFVAHHNKTRCATTSERRAQPRRPQEVGSGAREPAQPPRTGLCTLTPAALQLQSQI